MCKIKKQIIELQRTVDLSDGRVDVDCIVDGSIVGEHVSAKVHGPPDSCCQEEWPESWVERVVTLAGEDVTDRIDKKTERYLREEIFEEWRRRHDD